MFVVRKWPLMLLLIVTACLSPGEYEPIQYYDLRPEPAVAKATESTGLRVAVRPLDYARAYKQSMVIRSEGNQVIYDDMNRWVELPRDVITRALVDSLLQTDAFADVAYSTDISGPHLLIHGELREFDWVREGEAVAEMRIDLRDRRSDALQASRPISGDGAAAFASAMSEAVADILTRAAAEIVEAAQAYDPETEQDS